MIGKLVARSHNLGSEMLTELIDFIQTGIESYITIPNVPEMATKAIKKILDKKFGPSRQWIDEGFAYDFPKQQIHFHYFISFIELSKNQHKSRSLILDRNSFSNWLKLGKVK